MPMYEYECDKCHTIFEDLAGADDPCPQCPQCQAPTHKVVSRASIRTEYASPLDRGVAPIVGYNPTGRKPVCPTTGATCNGCAPTPKPKG